MTWSLGVVAVLSFLVLDHTSAQSSCLSNQYVVTKPVCSGPGKCCVEGNLVAASGQSGTISDARNQDTQVSVCTWTIGPFPQIELKFTSFDTEEYPLSLSEEDTVILSFSAKQSGQPWTKEPVRLYGAQGRTLSSTPGSTIYSTQSGYMKITWKLTSRNTRPGFTATWTVGPDPVKYPVCDSCPLNMQNTDKSLASISACACNTGWIGEVYTGPQTLTTFYPNLWCQSCEAGKYKSSTLVCTSCPAQSSSPVASSSCNCSAGFEGNPFVECKICPIGKYKASLAGTCIACPAGTISSATGSSSCELCTAGSTSSTDRSKCESCPDGTQPSATIIGQCDDCPRGFYSSIETNKRCMPCPSGFYSTAPRTTACIACRACPDGYHRANCTATAGGGECRLCLACPPDRVNVGCMNRAGNTDKPGACRNRTYVARTPLCDQSDSGLGLGGYTFLGLFGVPQDDASFQCRRRCDNQQNIMSVNVYDNATYTDLVRLFPNVQGIPRAFNGGHCGGPYACDVANCNIPGSADDSQTDYQPKLACPVHITPAMTAAFWAAVEAPNTGDAGVIGVVNAMRAEKCQTCAACGQETTSSKDNSVQDWGRGCARDCTQLSCEPGLIFDWTEPNPTARCKTCGDLDDVRLCLTSEQSAFDGYDVSGRLPKIYMRQCSPKRQLPLRGYEIAYGNCVRCADFVESCKTELDTYYHTCEQSGADIVATCRSCSRGNGRAPTLSRYWDGATFRLLYCQQPPCLTSDEIAYTGVATESLPHRICGAACKPIVCDGGVSQVTLPCVLPHQRRCKESVSMDASVTDAEFRAVAHAPAHVNVLEPNTKEPHLFSSFENALVDHDAPTLSLRAVCVWNADFIPDNSMNPAGVSARFQQDCRPWTRDPRMQYTLMPLQNVVISTDSAAFPRRVLLNTSAVAVAYSRGPVPRPAGVFAGDVYLELDLSRTNNATLTAFVPTDRAIDAATWVPRWRAAVHARQVVGDTTNLSLALDAFQTCFACFVLNLYPAPDTTATTVSGTTALASFRGDKFFFAPSPDLFVCEKAVQVRAYPAFLQTQYNASLAAMFASSLTDACVSRFGIRSQKLLGLPIDLVRSSDVVVSGKCVVYACSSTRVFCVRRAGGVEELAFLTPNQGTVVDLSVHEGVLVRTVHSGLFPSGDTANYMSLLSSIDSTSEAVVQVAGLIMFARGAPRYFLRRTTGSSLRLSKFETQNATFRMNASATYLTNDVCVLFSQFVPVSVKNTLLEFANGVLVFATAKYSSSRVIVHVSVLDVGLAPLNTYSMPTAVFTVPSREAPQRIEDPYENIESAGEALVSCAWLEPRVLLISVSVEGALPGQFAPLLLNASDLALLQNTLNPDLARAFDAPFVRAANAVISNGEVKYCAECMPATSDASSGFFAYGAALVSSRRLIACAENETYIEENTARSMPVKVCEEYRTDAGGRSSVLMELTLKCLTSSALEIILQVPPTRRVFFDSYEFSNPKQSRILLSLPCDVATTSIDHFDSAACVTGCKRTLISGGRLRIEGGIEITSVRHRPRISEESKTWDRRSLLQIATPRATYAPKPLTPDWREYSVTVRSLAPLQQLDVRVQRAASVAWLASFEDSEQRLALDALAVLPMLSEHFMPVVVANASLLATIVYLPSLANLRVLALEQFAYGDDVLDWARVHASLHVSMITPDIQQCAYLARVVAVDANLAVVSNPSIQATGCLLDLALSADCHLELPERLANAARVVGLTLSPTSSACRALTDADDISVELAPFMRISQCPPNSFLHADTLACAVCDAGAAACAAGKYVRGCRPLVHPASVLECIACTAPNNSFFPSTSRGCDAWTCLSGFYREDKACARCTTLLTNVCRATGGQRRQNCTTFENEKCIDCQPKPRYSEWVVSSSECSWRCKPGYFQNADACEACQTFEDTVAYFAISGTRVAGKFYRFAECTATAQARADVCLYAHVAGQYGTFIRDGDAFGEDCLLQCSPTSTRPHPVRVNVSINGKSWGATRCIQCPDSAWPVEWTGVRLPSDAFTMSTACVATCRSSASFYAHPNSARTCLFCPSNCASGQFRSARDNCTACQPCVRALTGSVFSAQGKFNDASSCPEACPANHFADAIACRPHSVLTCRQGLQYLVTGTATADARCDTCADCSGAKEVSPCTPTSNRQCASCGSLDAWSSTWSKTGCELVCRAELGYTKLYTTDGEICRKCLSCPPGQALPARPANCTCLPCAAGIPATAVYTVGCSFACPLYHVAQVINGALVCQYTIPPSPNSIKVLRRESPTSCPPGKFLAPDARPEAYGAFVCANCSIPRGLDYAEQNKTWTWRQNCAFSCAWGLEKLERQGNFSCDTLRYTHAIKPPTTQTTATGLQVPHVVGMAIAGVVCLIFALCFLGRMLF